MHYFVTEFAGLDGGVRVSVPGALARPRVRNNRSRRATLAVLVLVLYLAPTIGHHMSGTLQIIMTRLMGMILAAIAVEMVLVGLAHVFPGLTHR